VEGIVAASCEFVKSQEMIMVVLKAIPKILDHLPPFSKLTPSLTGSNNYVCHIRNFQFYLSKGIKVKKIHRVLSFK